MNWLSVSILCLTAASGMVRAGEIYKSVDANGNVVYSDHLDSSMAASTKVQLEDPRFPPHELRFCWTNCFTLILDKDGYRRADNTDETWTVETFTANAIVLHRHDAPAAWNGNRKDVVYAGQVANDRMINVTVNGIPTPGIDASFGAALNTLPGSNAERDAKPPENPGSFNGPLSSTEMPPPVPQEDQPPLSEDGVLWTPGYWYWRDQRYFWVKGAWARPPQYGLLWTPAYWILAGTVFVFHPGHWGATVGFYGGANYGYGYFGNGYTGGRWVGNSFAYNSAINHVNPSIARHTYAESGSVSGLAQVPGSRSPVAGIHPASQHQSPPATVSNSAKPTVVQRTIEKTPTPNEVNKPVAVVKAPISSASPKVTHVTASSVAPLKQ